MREFVIHIADDFTRFPTGRYSKHGAGSGETFRDEFLIPKLKDGFIVKVFIDGTAGYPASFIEEAFGGLVRKGFSLQELKERLKILADEKSYLPYMNLAWRYIEEANARHNASQNAS